MSKSRDIADSAATINYIDNVTSDVQTQLNTLTTAIDNVSVTSGTLTKTFTTGESSTINLTSSVLAPVVSVTKEVPQSGVTNNNWDVNSTTENYTRLNSAPATTLDFVSDDDVSAATETSITLSGASQSTDLLAGTIGNAGQNAYMLDQTSGIIYQYLLSTAYDLSSGSYESKTFDVSSQQSDPRNLFFKSDGTKLYVIGTTSQAIYQYSLSTAWDISTASYDSKTFSASAQSNGTSGLFIKPDGSKLYIVAYANDAIYQYSLSTAWDISTASYDSVSLSVSGQDSAPRDITFNDDGTVLYMCGTTNNALYQYNLTTAYDLSSASYSSNTLSLSTTVFSVTYSNASLQLVIFQSLTDILKTVRLSNTLSLGTGSFASADVGKTIEANSGVFVLTATDGSNVETTVPTSYAQVASGSWEMYGVVYNAADGDLELSGIVTNKFDISTASYSQSFSTSSQESNPTGIAFNTDGTKMFVLGQNTDAIYQYTLSTAFDISTATYDSVSFSVASQDTSPRGLTFNNDGTKMYLSGNVGDDINEYTLSTGFDISTASYSQSYYVGGIEGTPFGIAFNNDGTKMYFGGDGMNRVYQYTLSTAFDVSTAGSQQDISITQDSNVAGVTFNNDGTKMYIVGFSGDAVYEYTLSTGFNVTTASYAQSFSVASQETTPLDIKFNTDGTKMFIAGYAGVTEYLVGSFNIPTGYHAVHTTNSIDSTYWTDINSMTADQAAGDGNVYYAISTDDRTTWTVIDNTDGERDIVRNNAGTWQYNSNGTYASETWVNGTTNTELATIAEAMEGAAAGYALANASYDSVSFSIASQEGDPLDLAFKSDGTKLYVIGRNTDAIYQYSLSTAWDLSTASYDSVSFSVASQENSPSTLAFSSDGTKMYVSGYTNDTIFQYSLSSAWDLSTASYASLSFSIASQLGAATGIVFKDDGTKLYATGQASDSVFQYSLSTAWNISTASYDSVELDVSSQDTTPTGIAIKPDGTRLYIIGYSNKSIYEYTLSTAFDLSTASYSSIIFSVSGQGSEPNGLVFKSDGTKFYHVEGSTDKVYEYSSTSYTNQMDKTQLDAVTDPNHIALGNDLDLSIIFNMTSGTTVPSSDGVAINYDANILNQGAVLGTDYNFDAPAGNKVRITAVNAANYKVRVV